MTPRSDRNGPRDILIEADKSERIGDLTTAASKLRAHLADHADDDRVRLKLGRLLLALSEPASARQVLQPLDQSPDANLSGQANRLLATMDETEGALTSAQIRWERTLADDIDDPEARGHLQKLRPRDDHWPSDLSFATLLSPEGVRMSRFKLERELGRGATAAVYLVRDDRLGFHLALKVLHPQLATAARTGARESFFAEARVAARLRHPGVVAIYDVDEAARCLAMEFVSGGTVRDRLRELKTRIDPTEILGTARSILRALRYVHDAGIVHGDLKPGNILLRAPADIVLADFGVAAFTAAPPTPNDRAVGTPLYLAPEQFRGAPPSPRTDLFATGAILWELAHGRPARRQSDLLSGDFTAAAPIPADTVTSLGAAGTRLAALVASLLTVDPARRPVSAADALAILG
jgi:serine/threonine protein kinase